MRKSRKGTLMRDEPDFAAFWKSHDISVAVARAAFGFLRSGSLDCFEYEIKRIHDQHVGVLPDLPRKPRPALRLVTGD
jgi:hypothetical protein